MKTITETLNLAPQGKNFLTADWPAPANVKTLITTRNGGVSEGVYRSLNVGSHVGDNLEAGLDSSLSNEEEWQEKFGMDDDDDWNEDDYDVEVVYVRD